MCKHKSRIEQSEGAPAPDALGRVLVDADGLYCLARHFAAFYEQCLAHEPADFTEPCVECNIAEKCKYDWMERILPIVFQTPVRISVAHRGPATPEDSDCDHQDADNHVCGHNQTPSSCNQA